MEVAVAGRFGIPHPAHPVGQVITREHILGRECFPPRVEDHVAQFFYVAPTAIVKEPWSQQGKSADCWTTRDNDHARVLRSRASCQMEHPIERVCETR